MVERVEAQWWSVPQAIVWIVTLDETQVADAKGVRFCSEIERLPLPAFFSIGDEPPIAARRAPDVLLSAIRRGTVEVVGHYCGEEKAARVFLGDMNEVKWKDQDGGICIVDDFGSGPADYWSELAIRADECMRRWPSRGVSAPKTSTQEDRPSKPRKPTFDEVLAWYVRRVANHDQKQLPPSRPEDEKAAKRYFTEQRFDGRGIRSLVRRAREKEAPASWKETGAKSHEAYDADRKARAAIE